LVFRPTPTPTPAPEPVVENAFWSENDKNDNISVSTNGREVSYRGAFGGAVRSKHSIGPKSGFYYVEIQSINIGNAYTIGVATAEESLSSQSNSFSERLSFNTDEITIHGIAIDYRYNYPVVFFLQKNAQGVESEVRSVVRDDWYGEDVFIYLSTNQTSNSHVINLRRSEFEIDYESVIKELALVANDTVVAGWPSDDSLPQISIEADNTVVLTGTEITLTSTATDDEDGDISASTEWFL